MSRKPGPKFRPLKFGHFPDHMKLMMKIGCFLNIADYLPASAELGTSLDLI